MYDIIIIGGGSAGYRAAEIAGKYGKRVLLVEKKSVGGTCLHEGCIPMKTYLHMCEIKEKAMRVAENNIFQNFDVPKVNLEALSQNTCKTISNLEKGVLSGLKGVGVEIINGTAKIISASTENVTLQVDDKIFKGKNCIIATGSQAVNFSGTESAKTYNIIGSSDIFNLKDSPKNICIIGGGAVGLEAASLFQSLGSKVTVAESLPYIGGEMDREFSQLLQKLLEKRGIRFLLNTKFEKFLPNEILFSSDDKIFSESFEYVLIAVGRKPFTDHLGLENIGVDYDKNGIVIDEHCRTSNPMIYACGDVTGKIMLAHVAYMHSKVAVDNICGKKSILNYDTVPKIIYSFPTYISVGFSEEYCRDKKISYLTKQLPMTYNGKYYAENGRDGGRVKILITPETQRLLGFHAVGIDITELDSAAEIMINNKMCLEDIKNFIFAHPTFGEIFQTLANSTI